MFPLRYSAIVRLIRRHWLAALLLFGFAGLLAVQLFLPGFIGIADSSDFAKVAGRLCLGPLGGHAPFEFFQPIYVRSARSCWDSPFPSSEAVLGWGAVRLAGVTQDGDRFDIRWLGAIHVALCMIGFIALLAALRKQPKRLQLLVAAVPLLLLTDVCYAALLNSFYMDAAAFCALVVMAGVAIWICVEDEPGPASITLFFAAALLFATAKTQHALWSIFPAVFLAASCLRMRRRPLTALTLVMASVVFVSGAYMEITADRGYKGQALFNVLFYRIGSQGPAAMPDLVKLGVHPDEVRYLGMHSYAPGSPMQDQAFADDFYQRTGLMRLMGWYLQHPVKTFHMVTDRMLWEKEIMRANNLGNYRAGDGHGPSARTHRFGWWSDLRSTLFHLAPWYLPLWYGVFAAVCAWAIVHPRSPVSLRLAWLALSIGLLGAGEFMASNLADCLDTARHLLLFHACTDLTVCFAAAWAAQRVMLPAHSTSTGAAAMPSVPECLPTRASASSQSLSRRAEHP
jgi:hypothetical protein